MGRWRAISSRLLLHVCLHVVDWSTFHFYHFFTDSGKSLQGEKSVKKYYYYNYYFVLLVIIFIIPASRFEFREKKIGVFLFLISSLLGSMRGHLKKKRKDDNNWNTRLFVLSNSKLSYYIKEQVCDSHQS